MIVWRFGALYYYFSALGEEWPTFRTHKRAEIDHFPHDCILFDFLGFVNYKISIVSNAENLTCRVSLIDKKGNVIVTDNDSRESSGVFEILDPNLWWPYLMDPNPGYLYTLQVELLTIQGALIDKYSQPIGIRSVSWSNTSLFINNKRAYLHGFGRHEDSDIRGKGLDLPLIIRDYNLIKWIGANAYRTSHYPYAEEIMDLADEFGIMIIDECPSVNTEFFFDSLLVKHKNSLTELIKRDKNRPSVIMWSASNEPRTQFPVARTYFKQVIEHIKSLDETRPTTIVEAQAVNSVYSVSINLQLLFSVDYVRPNFSVY